MTKQGYQDRQTYHVQHNTHHTHNTLVPQRIHVKTDNNGTTMINMCVGVCGACVRIMVVLCLLYGVLWLCVDVTMCVGFVMCVVDVCC